MPPPFLYAAMARPRAFARRAPGRPSRAPRRAPPHPSEASLRSSRTVSVIDSLTRVPDLRLEPLSATTAVAANSLTLKPGQEQFAVPDSYAGAEQTVSPSAAWPRVVLDGDEVVGFIKGSFDAEESRPEFRCCIWQINVSATAQGRGVGRFAVHGLADEARGRGFDRLTVIWEGGDAGPEAFFLAVGFRSIGETRFGETIGALDL